MAELFPEDPKLSHFSGRFSTDGFDPIAARLIVSPASQLRPKFPVAASIEQPPTLSAQNSPRPQGLRAQNSPRPNTLPGTNSPKRPFPADDFDDLNPPRKIHRTEQQEYQRGASPLKGAAGRRLDQQRRHGGVSHIASAAPIPRDVTFLLGLIPPAHTYNSHRFNTRSLVQLLQDTVIPDYSTWKSRSHGGQQLSAASGLPHSGQLSSDHTAQYSYQNRDSPAPQGRPASPYTGGTDRSRLGPAPTPFAQPLLRPGSSGSFEPAHIAHHQSVVSAQTPSSYIHVSPSAQVPYENVSWPSHGTAVPPATPQAYPSASNYAQPTPAQSQPPYGRYPYQ